MKMIGAALGVLLLLAGCAPSGPSAAETECVRVFVSRVGDVPQDQAAKVAVAAASYCQKAEQKDPDTFEKLYG